MAAAPDSFEITEWYHQRAMTISVRVAEDDSGDRPETAFVRRFLLKDIHAMICSHDGKLAGCNLTRPGRVSAHHDLLASRFRIRMAVHQKFRQQNDSTAAYR